MIQLPAHLCVLALFSLTIISCGRTQFYGGTPKQSTESKTPDPCDIHQLVAPMMALVIDNSSSNGETDCPGATRRNDGFTCNGETQREKAIRNVLDEVLIPLAEEGDNRTAVTPMQIASFPTSTDSSMGWQVHTDAWMDASSETESVIMESLSFARQPGGFTPYTAALTATDRIFSSTPDRLERNKLALLITDGEPTDSDPEHVRGLADTLAEKGVSIVTIFVTGNGLHETRKEKHANLLQSYGYPETVIDQIIGRNGHPELVQAISDSVHQVADIDDLKPKVEEIVRSIVRPCD